jgi:hypothetical protein
VEKITIQTMVDRITHRFGALVPSVKEEGYALDERSLPEKIFYCIVDGIRSLLKSKIDREKGIFFDQFFVDTLLFFIVFLVLAYFLYYLPRETYISDPSKNLLFNQLVIIVFLASLLWAGYIYIIQSFKNLTREKLLPAIEKIPDASINYQRFFRQIFGGWKIEWKSGFGFNFYIRSTFLILILITGMIYPVWDSLSEIFTGVFILHSVDALIALYLSVVAMSIVFILAFMAFLTIFTVPLIFIYLWVSARFLPLEINTFREMGGVGAFGKLVVHCIFLVSLALGMIPLSPLLGKIDLSFLSHVTIPAETLGNTTVFIRTQMENSVKSIPMDTFSKYIGYIEWYLIILFLAFLVILILHDGIKRHKEEELALLERKIAAIDFNNSDNSEDKLYYLDLYEKVLGSSEWPIKKIFGLELIVSVLPLFVSFLIS